MRVEVILLAAGASRRMGGVDKLLREIEGDALLRRAAKAAVGSKAEAVHVVLPPGHGARKRVLHGLAVKMVEAEAWREGMAASLRAGLAEVSPECDGVIISLADMPEVAAGDYDRLLAAFDPAAGREICRAVTDDGALGHPVLFGRRFFSDLSQLQGDRGARDVLAAEMDVVLDVATGQGAVIDLDTPEDWVRWQTTRK